MIYNSYKYIFPPRPQTAVPQSDLDYYDNDTMILQPKLDGSNCVIFTNGVEIRAMNRHNQTLTGFQLSEEVLSLFKNEGNKWFVINGEYLNKSKNDENGRPFNHKLIIFDILVNKSEYLVGLTLSQRLEILDSKLTKTHYNKFYSRISDNVFMVNSFNTGFKKVFDELLNIQVIEGVVIKRSGAKLEAGTNENNNTRSMVKSRKPTKNFRF